MANAQQVITAHLAHPAWHADQIARELSCHPGYVRATAQRQGLSLPNKPKKPKLVRVPGTKKKYRLARNGDTPDVYFSANEQLSELFFEFFIEAFWGRAVFEEKPSLLSEFKAARKNGQTITGFLMGDPLPHRSALALKRHR